jgi:hypothetical protein
MFATTSQNPHREAHMPTTSRALLTEIIDYAGLFPPAKLPMEEAFRRFLDHRGGSEGWLLARFVCPAARLAELAPLIENADPGAESIRIAVLGAGGDDPPAFSASIEHDAASMRVFSERLGGAAIIDVFEVKLPAHGHPSEVVDLTFHHLADVADRTPAAFFETPLVGDPRDPAPVAVGIAAAGHKIDPNRRAGLKIRCGGLDAAAVPTVDAVAAAIVASLATGLPLKATQGLHHPFRHHDPALDTMVHGFVNILAASILAQSAGADEDGARAMLSEEDPAAFTVDEHGLRWRDLAAGVAAIVDGRSTAMVGIGSCSFTEPRDDLAGLGWLNTNAEL